MKTVPIILLWLSAVITSQSQVVVRDVHFYNEYISGILSNATGRSGSFRVKYSVFGAGNAKIEVADAYISELKPSETWKFKALILHSDDVKSAQFDGVEMNRREIYADHKWFNQAEPPPPTKPKTQEEIAEEKRRAEEQAKADRLVEEANQKHLREEAARAEEERMHPIRERAVRVLANQLKNASNGFAYAQYEVGLRYLRGDGVETNRELAVHWLAAACTNGYTQASNTLAKLRSE